MPKPSNTSPPKPSPPASETGRNYRSPTSPKTPSTIFPRCSRALRSSSKSHYKKPPDYHSSRPKRSPRHPSTRPSMPHRRHQESQFPCFRRSNNRHFPFRQHHGLFLGADDDITSIMSHSPFVTPKKYAANESNSPSKAWTYSKDQALRNCCSPSPTTASPQILHQPRTTSCPHPDIII